MILRKKKILWYDFEHTEYLLYAEYDKQSFDIQYIPQNTGMDLLYSCRSISS